ncbi:hypothetical protein OUZ56_015834 [Daphnia magna]|uniref:Uncharacterized protein n=1 Tax=Daphnia magna TaxID=35525 RepID=A0ABR0ANW1_9CRUS|nr:hypothetical protein OUZ56_015834 [Daphnia magna]
MGYGIWNSKYGIWDVGCGMWDMGYGIWDMGYGIWDMGYGIWDMGYGIWDMGYGIWDMGYGIWDMGYGIWDMGYGIWDMGYGIWDMGYGIWDMGFQSSFLKGINYRSSCTTELFMIQPYLSILGTELNTLQLPSAYSTTVPYMRRQKIDNVDDGSMVEYRYGTLKVWGSIPR